MKRVEGIYGWLLNRLSNQLLLTHLLVITFALVIVSLWALFAIKAESLNDLRNSLEVEAVNLALEIDNDLALDSEQATNRIKAATIRRAQRLGFSMTVVNNDGHVLADYGPKALQEGENISNQPEINDALAGLPASYTRSSPRTHTDWLYVAYPIRSAGQTGGVIRVGVPLTELNQRLNRDLIIFLEIIGATLVAATLISLWLAKRVTRPISEMSEMARQIAKSGDISVFVPVQRQDEIGELGLSFNQMIGRLREEEQVRQEFIANASHELKTPTMAISSVVEALQAGAVDDPELRKQFLNSLESLVDRQSSLIRDLLDVTQLDAGDKFVWQQQLNLSEIITEAVEQIRAQAKKKSIKLEIEKPSSDQEISVDGNGIQLQRAFVNLLTNAVNYTPANGQVKLLVQREDEKVIISIHDTGSGIDPADLPHIFERFYRGDKARTRAAGGTGLGLAITKEIIVRHQGTIEVETQIGKGTTFFVKLPAGVAAVEE